MHTSSKNDHKVITFDTIRTFDRNPSRLNSKNFKHRILSYLDENSMQFKKTNFLNEPLSANLIDLSIKF